MRTERDRRIRPDELRMSRSDLVSVVHQVLKDLMPKRKPSGVMEWSVRTLDNLDMLIGKFSKPWMYALETAGIFWIFHIVAQFDSALQSLRGSANELQLKIAQAQVAAVKTAADSTYLIVFGICMGIPGIIAFLRSRKKRWEMSLGGLKFSQEIEEEDTGEGKEPVSQPRQNEDG